MILSLFLLTLQIDAGFFFLENPATNNNEIRLKPESKIHFCVLCLWRINDDNKPVLDTFPLPQDPAQ